MFTVSRSDEVARLIEAGLTYAEIGRRLGVSRQRAWQIASRNPDTARQPKVMLTTRDVAQRLGVHIDTVRYWTKTGKLKSYRFSPRGHMKFRRQDIDDFLKK